MKQQLKVGLEPGLRSQLEAAADAAGRPLAEEIRARLTASFEADSLDKPTRELTTAIGDFSTWVRLQTGRNWSSHPAALWAFRCAIDARLARWLSTLQPSSGKAAEDAMPPVFAPGELPKTLIVNSEDPETQGLAIEAMVWNSEPKTEAARRQLAKIQEEAFEEIRKRHQEEHKS